MRSPRAALAWHLCWGIVVHMAGAHKDHCVHVHPRPDEVIHGVHIEPAHVMRRRSADQQLRVKLSYDRSVFRLSKEKFDLINNTVLPQAVQYWEKALRVRRVENVIRLNRKCLDNKVFYKKGDPLPYCKSECENVTMCGEVAVPTDHLQACRVCNWLGRDCHVAEEATGPGLTGADFVFYISALETDRCHRGMTVAYAAHCQQEAALDRPIAGHANLCPSSISTKQQELQTLISTVKHEMLHALGFSVSLYAFFRDKEGNPLTERGETGKPLLNPALQARQWSDKIIKTFQRPGWLTAEGNVTRTVQMVVTPRVVEEVRRHFDCPELEGAELEDQGEEGTALTHWEKRLFENEAMTGTHTQNPVYSRLTLALMEDTGWYLPNYEMAQPLRWGRGLGCQFAMNSCKHWMDMRAARNESPHPFCNKVKRDPLETECTEDRNSVALCNLVQYQDRLPARYQNFDSVPQVPSSRTGYYGGSVILADYCPYIQEFTWKSNNVIVRGSHCSFSENNPDEDRNFALEEYAASSRCFEHTRLWEERTCHKVRQWQHWGSGCYRHACLAGRVHVTVANHTYTCFHEGQEIDISLLSNSWLHVGAIRCPRCSQICPDMECKPDRPVPETVRYYADSLRCGAGALAASAAAPALLAAAWSLALVWQ
ncbi:leishmanolysin-like peptidase isoform X2 [Amphibalanus amphitrite]|uniref:leishmanolysin-like peptidase isoform X2 n=1 Tax=Amphibalanus amphitrite TaxID=1232801 RepID=UPI001C911857|nr:leishmanolysin-like peptidase isoform X2 [Amphibalanus amphitrite]XP_043215096.1 leishmanolysin-like peptidase isoform X2 [Amphibalanus amphitrite]XP_043215097.1 leishmanolysin-like peptidase isoform X2 [Amphibalanus amphitrite]